MVKNNIIQVDGVDITIASKGDMDYLCLTDMTTNFEGGSKLIEKWLNNKSTIEFLGVWENLYNSRFNSPEFGGIKNETGSNKFYISIKKFIEKTNAIGIIAKAGKYGGTYAHKDIAYHFGMWLSPEFNLLVVKEFQRLKEEEEKYLKSPEWIHRRFLTKVNYTIQTDAIKEYILPNLNLPKDKENIIYAQEAELLNKAVFGYTSKEWVNDNQEKALKGENIRDNADISQLIALSNAQVLNKELIKQGLSQSQRLQILQTATEETIKSLNRSPTLKAITPKRLSLNKNSKQTLKDDEED
ncbi:hypothetical protein EZS27_006986 [termite gut metagenome]|uniref:KilA-N domain-containing protein n=1 Tax=termite gut metagenome TaxID=433724 RepID=A0A5J4SJG8_9ZZZZ